MHNSAHEFCSEHICLIQQNMSSVLCICSMFRVMIHCTYVPFVVPYYRHVHRIICDSVHYLSPVSGDDDEDDDVGDDDDADDDDKNADLCFRTKELS